VSAIAPRLAEAISSAPAPPVRRALPSFDGQLAASSTVAARSRPAGSTSSAAPCSSQPRQGRAARPQDRHARPASACTAAHRHQEAALCRDFLQPAFASAQAAKPYIEATVRLQGALGAMNDRAVAARCWPTSPRGRARRGRRAAAAQLAKQAASGDKRRRRKLQRAWKTFRKAERFWSGGLRTE
jgi:hypothetical protein